MIFQYLKCVPVHMLIVLHETLKFLQYLCRTSTHTDTLAHNHTHTNKYIHTYNTHTHTHTHTHTQPWTHSQTHTLPLYGTLWMAVGHLFWTFRRSQFFMKLSNHFCFEAAHTLLSWEKMSSSISFNRSQSISESQMTQNEESRVRTDSTNFLTL